MCLVCRRINPDCLLARQNALSLRRKGHLLHVQCHGCRDVRLFKAYGIGCGRSKGTALRAGVKAQAVPAAPAPLPVHVRGDLYAAHKPARFSVGAGHAFLCPVSAILPFAAVLVQGKDNANALLPAASCRICGFHPPVGRPGKGRARKERDKNCEENEQAGKSLHLVFRRKGCAASLACGLARLFPCPEGWGSKSRTIAPNALQHCKMHGTESLREGFVQRGQNARKLHYKALCNGRFMVL